MRILKITLLCCISIVLLYIAVSLCVLFFCEPSNEFYGPDGGVWHCDELGIQISFERDQPSLAAVHGEYIVCATSRHRGSKHINVSSQDHRYLGESVFKGKYISFDNDRYVLKDKKTNRLYTFVPGPLDT